MTDILVLRELFSLIAKTKRLERTGWLKHKVPRPVDTTASYTTGAAILGWVRAKEEGLNSKQGGEDAPHPRPRGSKGRRP